jgi:hypothetical protein
MAGQKGIPIRLVGQFRERTKQFSGAKLALAVR